MRKSSSTAKTVILRRILLIGLAVSTLLLLTDTPRIYALSLSGLESLRQERGFYDPETECYGGPRGDAPAGAGSTTLTGVSVTGTSAVIAGDPLSLRNPTILDPKGYGDAMVNFIKKERPNSPWLEISDLGGKLVSEGQKRNVNMMMIIVIGRQESELGLSRVARQNKNSFGNKGNGPNGYRTWPSFEESLFGDGSFTELYNGRINGKHESYKNVKNSYEYISVHVSGQIIYPGDKTAVHDELMDEVVDDDAVLRYWNNAIKWIGEMSGFTISGVPTRGSGSAPAGDTQAASAQTNNCPANSGSEDDGTADGAVNVDGYFFPVAPRTKIDYADVPCKATACHHDGTPAADLYFGKDRNMDNKPVYALTDGYIVNVDEYGSHPECREIQFRSTRDNFYYWYGHVTDVQVSSGQKGIKGGSFIARVAPYSFGNSCRGGRDHLHIDRGCVNSKGEPQRGGSPKCRHKGFVPLMNKIWEGLPPGDTDNKFE